MDTDRLGVQRRLSYDAGDQRHADYPEDTYRTDLLFASIIDWLNTIGAPPDLVRRYLLVYRGTSLRGYVKGRKENPIGFFGSDDSEEVAV